MSSPAEVPGSIPEFFSEYAGIALILALSALTVFRRQISCNHCYNEDPPVAEAPSSVCDSTTFAWDDEEAEELLDGAGRYCSGESLKPIVLRLVDILFSEIPQLAGRQQLKDKTLAVVWKLFWRPPKSISLESVEETMKNVEPSLFERSLPLDAQLHVLSYLSPQDIVSTACVCRSSRKLVDQGESSVMIWRDAFRRDFGWLLEKWDVGREAVGRSNNSEPSYSKDFYFRFALTYTNYLLAGKNTFTKCLVGIGGHIYDLSMFLASHPGSPETVMAHAGTDATEFFDGMNHSIGARQFAMSMCIVVDQAFVDRNGTACRPAHFATCQFDKGIPATVPAPETYTSQTRVCKRGTPNKILVDHQRQEREIRRVVDRMTVERPVLGNITPYFDPIDGTWKAWYTSTDFETVFVDEVLQN